MENLIRTENCTIGSRIENVLPTKIQDLVRITKILDLVNIGQILNSKYLVVNFSIVELVVNVIDGKSVDESKTFLFTSISTFCLFVEMEFNEKEHETIYELMPHFGNNAFLEFNEKECRKAISELMSHFNNMFSEFDEKI